MRRALSRLPFLAGRTLLDGPVGRTLVRARHGVPTRPRSLVVLRLDGIGDYVLFRNFLPVLRDSARFAGYRVTLCGNALWRDLAETLDAGVVDGFEWIDTRAFQSSLAARHDVFARLAALGAGTVIQPRHSREAGLEDAVVGFLRDAESIGSLGDDHNLATARKARTDRLYDTLIPVPDDAFEFEANRAFFEALVGRELPGVGPRIDRAALGPRRDDAGPYAVIFPGAGETRRRWSADRFGAVVDHLIAETGLRVAICGGPGDGEVAAAIARGRPADRVEDRTGRTPLPDLAALIADATVLVSNETGAVHIGAASGTPTLCVSNGNHFGRFTEYPPRLATCVTTLYPPAVEAARDDPAALRERYRRGSFEDIDSIDPARAVDALRRMI